MERKCPQCGHIVLVAGNAAPDIMLKCSQCGSVDMLRNYLPLTCKDVFDAAKAGDKVVVSKFSGNEIKLDGVEYKFVKQDDILAVVTD